MVSWNSDILAFLPASEQSSANYLVTQNPASQQLRLIIRSNEHAALESFAQAVQARTQSDGAMDWVNPADQTEQLFALYRAYAGNLASDEALQKLRSADYQGMIDDAWRRLGSPTPMLVANFTQDPLLLTERFLTPALGNIRDWNEYGFELTADTPSWLLLGTLQTPAFHRDTGRMLTQVLAEEVTRAQELDPDFQLVRSGVVFHASEAAQQAEWEINLFGTLSLVGVFCLIWFSFGRIRPFIVVAGVLAIALLSGFAVTVLIFKQIHLLALVFATTLIGVAVDYAIHGVLSVARGHKTFHQVLSHLRLGLASTLIGYVVLFFLPFPLFSQVAVFIGSGLLAAYLAVHFWVVRFVGQPGFEVRAMLLTGSQKYLGIFQKIPARFNSLCFIAVFLIAGLAFWQLSFSDNVRLFTQSSASLLHEESTVMEALGESFSNPVLVHQAADVESLLQAQEQLRGRLRRMQEQGLVASWNMLADQVSSQARQTELLQRQHALWRSDIGADYLQALGMDIPVHVNRWMHVEQLSAFQRQSLIELDDNGIAAFVQVRLTARGVAEPLDLAADLGFYWFTPLDDAAKVLSTLRSQLMLWVVLALLGAFAVLWWRRSLPVAVSGSVYLAFVLAFAMWATQWFGLQLTVFNLVAGIMVLALAIDYVIFFSAPLRPERVQVAVGLSAVTSMLAFGILAVSATPLIAGFGVTVLLGIVMAAVCAPLFIRFSGQQAQRETL